MNTTCTLPASMLPYAERAWMRFPQALLALGHPMLEDEFEMPPACGSSVCLDETASHKIIQVSLVRKPLSAVGDSRHLSSLYAEHQTGNLPPVGPHFTFTAGGAEPQFPCNFPEDLHHVGWEVETGVPVPQWPPPAQHHDPGICTLLDALEQEMSLLCGAWNTQSSLGAQQGRVDSLRFDSLEKEISQLHAQLHAQKTVQRSQIDLHRQKTQTEPGGQNLSAAHTASRAGVQQAIQRASSPPQPDSRTPGYKPWKSESSMKAPPNQRKANQVAGAKGHSFKPPARGPVDNGKVGVNGARKRSNSPNFHSPKDQVNIQALATSKAGMTGQSSKGGLAARRQLTQSLELPKELQLPAARQASRSTSKELLIPGARQASRSSSPDYSSLGPDFPKDGKDSTKSRSSLQGRRKLSQSLALPGDLPANPNLKGTAFERLQSNTRLSFENHQEQVLRQPLYSSYSFDEEVLGDVSKPIIQSIQESIFPILPAAFPKKKTMIFFDWDDTICPTTWIKQTLTAHLNDSKQWAMDEECPKSKKAFLDWQKQIPAWFYHPLPEEDHWQEGLQKLQQEAIDMLLTAQKLGVVCIVTNAVQGWVEKTMKRWLPRLQPYILGHGARPAIKVFYGQDWGCKTKIPHVDEFHEMVWWKKGAMTHCLEIAQSLYRLPTTVKSARIDTVISVGDSEAEMFGAVLAGFIWKRNRRNRDFFPDGGSSHRRSVSLSATNSCLTSKGGPWIKLVKYIDEPGIDELRQQLVELSGTLRDLCQDPRGHYRFDVPEQNVGEGWEVLRDRQGRMGVGSVRRTQSVE